MINLLLFIITIGATLFVGAIGAGGNPIRNVGDILLGIPFSFGIMSILSLHELAHYIAARFHRVKASLPYFIPAPTLLGTLGAVIVMKSPMPSRRSLLDIGIAGPIGSFVLSIIFLIIGLNLSTVNITPPESERIALGSSILFSFIADMVKGQLPDGYSLMLHPIAFAGWIGLLVTGLNLIPAGQLDGGHIAYALLGKWHVTVAKIAFISLLLLGIFTSRIWLFWALLILFMGLQHPPPIDNITPLDRKRKILAIFGLIMLIVSFPPVPIK
jgi:membrane-associated protease RseP (regulator of RpoE activity)